MSDDMDLVEAGRDFADHCERIHPVGAEIVRRMATEITRLRGNVETGNKMIVEQASEVARLNAEIERLRGALHGERFAHQRTTEWWDTTRVERDRLRDGIAEHKAAALADGDCDCDECATTLPGFPSYDRFLWSLIEEET